jgi:membrane-bound lytic murein transglycosylase D
MNTVRETERIRCTPVKAAGTPSPGPRNSSAQHRDELLRAQGRALRIASFSLVAAFALVLGLVTAADRDGETIAPDEVIERTLAEVTFPIRVNDRVERWMYRYLTDQRAQFQLFLDREGIYSSMIRQKLGARGMPEELVYLAAVESAFSPTARSRVSAMGMWQFMDPTARAYGLRVDEWVDERRDPVKATDAALDYLQALHEQFGSWYVAAAAYNAGPSRVARLIRAHAGDRWGDEDLYWELIDQLPFETREYVPKLIAANLLAREATTFGFAVAETEPYRYDQVFVPGGTSLAGLAAAMEVHPRELQELNPHLIRGVTPPGTSYPVRVPRGNSAVVVASLSPISGSGSRAVD